MGRGSGGPARVMLAAGILDFSRVEFDVHVFVTQPPVDCVDGSLDCKRLSVDGSAQYLDHFVTYGEPIASLSGPSALTTYTWVNTD